MEIIFLGKAWEYILGAHMNQKKRVTYLDMAKGVGIVLMVAGHLIGSVQTFDNKAYFKPTYHWIASFHMPLFFIISGILLWITKEEKLEIKQIVSRKARTLLLPYATFSTIYMLMNVCTCIFKPELLKFSDLGKFLIYAFTFRGISVLWFLPALFISEVLFLWCRKRLGDRRLTLLFCLTGLAVLLISPVFRWKEWENSYWMMTLGSLLQTACRGLLACTFLLVGYQAAKLLQKNEKKTLPGFLAGVGMAAAGGILCFQNGTADLNYMVFHNILLYMLCACASSLGVILICKNFYQSRLLRFYGVNSLVIMATHMEFRVMLHSIKFAYWLNQYVTRAKEYVLFFTMAVCISLLEVVIIYIYNHYLYFLIGKKKPDKALHV